MRLSTSEAARRPSGFLLAGWLLTLALGVSSAAVVVHGARPDVRSGEATIHLSLGQASAWQTSSFRVWSDGQYRLFVSTVNFDRPRVGLKFNGELQVVVRRGDGTTLLDQRVNPETTDHRIPYNYGDTRLGNLTLEKARIRPWTVAVRRADTEARRLDSTGRGRRRVVSSKRAALPDPHERGPADVRETDAERRVSRDQRVCSANASPTRRASEDVFACAMCDVTAMTMPLSCPVVNDITMPPASSPLTLPGFVASAKRTRSDGVE
jgi:hypothetical protein